jgi:hypothetical protein
MKKISTLIVFVMLAFCFKYVQAQEPQKSVVDYFMLMPGSLWDLNRQNYTDDQKTRMIDEKDIKNGWLKFSGKEASNAWEGWGEFVIFKKPDKTYMMAITIMSCGPACDQTLKFFEYTNTAWKEVTQDVFLPMTARVLSEKYASMVGKDEFTEQPPVLYVLPRYGTSIKVITQKQITDKEITLATYSYMNGKFVLNTK